MLTASTSHILNQYIFHFSQFEPSIHLFGAICFAHSYFPTSNERWIICYSWEIRYWPEGAFPFLSLNISKINCRNRSRMNLLDDNHHFIDLCSKKNDAIASLPSTDLVPRTPVSRAYLSCLSVDGSSIEILIRARSPRKATRPLSLIDWRPLNPRVYFWPTSSIIAASIYSQCNRI